MPPSRPMPELPVAAERSAEVADEEAVHPDGAGVQSGADPLRALLVARDEGGRQAEAGVVGHLDGLLFAGKGLDRQDRAENLLGEDLAARLGVDQDRGPVVEVAQLVVR